MRARSQLRSLCAKVTSGGTPSRSHAEYYSPDEVGHLWIKSKELLDCSIADSEERITDSGLKNSSAKYLPACTVLVAMYGANVGQLGWLRRPATVNQAICGLVVDAELADHRYVFYALMDTRAGLIAQAQGAAQQNLNQDKIKDFEIPCPELVEQRRIASILSAYDDLIENNTRRIAILEEMARRIYEEWFVRFRFPGHEGARMVESELGLVPEGWRHMPVTDVAAFKYGKGLPTKHLADDAPFPVYGAAKIIGRYTEYTRKDRSLIVGCRGSVGVPQITLPRCFVTNNSFTADPVHPAGQLWLYLLLQSRGLKDVVGGAAQPQITLEGLSGAAVLNPPPPLIDRFDALVRPMFQLQWSLIGRNENLRTTRDLLLPKLISGELDVSAMPEPEALAA